MNDVDKLIDELGKCKKCLNIRNRFNHDCSLINIYENKEFSKKIPSIWTDWYNRLNSKIMIIGQDWGPFKEMKKYHQLYMENETKENWQYIINQEKSLTKKNLEKFIRLSAMNNDIPINDDFFSTIYITNAIMCARKGDNYRGNDINIKLSTLNCSQFLKRQIDILKPEVILTLGYYPLLSLSKIYDFAIANNLTDTIKKTPVINLESFIIIPLYHPAAQISIEKQLTQYNRIWNINNKF